MSGHYLRRRARGANWAYRFAALSGALLVVSVVFYRLDVLNLQALSWSVVVTAALLAIGLLFALMALARAWTRGDRGGGRALAALLLGLVVFIPFAAAIALAVEYPRGNLAETAGLTGQPAQISPVPGASGASARAAPLLQGRDYRATAADVFEAARNTLEQSGWEVTNVETASTVTPADGDLGVSGTILAPVPTPRDTLDLDGEYDRYAELDSEEYVISAVAYAPVLGFPSDVTIRISEDNGVTFVDLRSQSRLVAHDLGQNRRFIEAFLGRLDAAMELLQNVVVED